MRAPSDHGHPLSVRGRSSHDDAGGHTPLRTPPSPSSEPPVARASTWPTPGSCGAQPGDLVVTADIPLPPSDRARRAPLDPRGELYSEDNSVSARLPESDAGPALARRAHQRARPAGAERPSRFANHLIVSWPADHHLTGQSLGDGSRDPPPLGVRFLNVYLVLVSAWRLLGDSASLSASRASSTSRPSSELAPLMHSGRHSFSFSTFLGSWED